MILRYEHTVASLLQVDSYPHSLHLPYDNVDRAVIERVSYSCPLSRWCCAIDTLHLKPYLSQLSVVGSAYATVPRPYQYRRCLA